MAPQPVALVPAAGFSSRMGAFKPLLPLADGMTPLGCVCALYARLRIPVLVISGHRGDEVDAAARALGAATVRNPRPADGMFSSIRIGLTALPASCTHVFVHPADMPLVRPLTVTLLLERSAGAPEAVLVPHYQGQKGHPPLLPANALEAVRHWDGPDGLRGALATLTPRVPALAVPVPDACCLLDMDTPAALAQLRALWPERDMLSPADALELLNVRGVSTHLVAHGQAVGRLAEAFARALNARGAHPALDTALARSGGLLHDLCKGAPRHGQAAADYLRAHGLSRLAPLVEHHQDMALTDGAALREKELICLADKYVCGAGFIPLEQRYARKLKRYADNVEACAAIRQRLERAQQLDAALARQLDALPAELAARTLASTTEPCA